MAAPYIGHGLRAGYAPLASPTTWKRFEQVAEAAPPTVSSDKVDSTHHGTLGRLKRSIPGEQTVSDVTINMIRDGDPATSPIQDTVFDLNLSSDTVIVRIEVPSTSDPENDDLYEVFQFEGRCSAAQVVSPRPGLVMLNTTWLFDDDTLTHQTQQASVF